MNRLDGLSRRDPVGLRRSAKTQLQPWRPHFGLVRSLRRHAYAGMIQVSFERERWRDSGVVRITMGTLKANGVISKSGAGEAALQQRQSS